MTTHATLPLTYARRGWPVFPCRAADSHDPETGEILAIKSPLLSNGFRGATKNERIIKELWKRNPGALIGCPTGDPMGAWVLDLDIKPGVGNGFEWLEAMIDEHGPLPETAQAQTINGGRHIYFRYAHGVRNRGKLGACVDVRGAGGYVILPGSVTEDGREYFWYDHDGDSDTDGETIPPIADAPQWLLDLVLPPPAPARHDYTYVTGDNEPYVERAVEDEMCKLAGTGQGSRGYQLNASAFSLGTMVGAGALSRQEAEAKLFEAASACGVLAKDGERETLAKIRRGLDSGTRQPRDIPAPEYDSDNTRLVDVTRMIERGLAKGKGPREPDSEPASTKTEKPKSDAASKPGGDADAGRPQSTDTGQQPETKPETKPETLHETLHATPFTWLDPTKLPQREFAYGTHYIRKYVSVTVSPGGLGKTSNSVAESLSMVSQKQLLGIKPPQRMRVWLFNAEDPRDEMERRIMAACLHYKLKPEDIEGRLFLDTGREQELVVAREDRKTGVRIVEPIVEAIADQIQTNSIDVMVVDPFVSTHQVNENDNSAIDKVAKLWAQIADYTNCAIDVVHHLRKVSDREATVEDARGAVALIGAARSVRVLNRMSEEQATAAGVPVAERYSYFNVHQGKANLTQYSSAMDWRKLESVALGNGRGLSKPQDHAGVVTSWRWPSSEDLTNGLTPDQLERIKTLLDNGTYKHAPQGRPWAGEAVAAAIDADLDDKASKKRVAAILKALIAEDVLAVVRERDTSSRQLVALVRSA